MVYLAAPFPNMASTEKDDPMIANTLAGIAAGVLTLGALTLYFAILVRIGFVTWRAQR